MALAIFDIITIHISKVAEAVFDAVEYRLAKRVLRQGSKTDMGGIAPGRPLIEGMRTS